MTRNLLFLWRIVIARPENRDRDDRNSEHRINERIHAEKVRLVTEEGEPRIIPIVEALAMAAEKSMDLVEISPNQDPPVVKIMDYSKFRFEQSKKAKEARKKQKVFHVKEVKLRPAIADNDYNHKMNQAKSFLEKGDKVKFTLVFRGREVVHSELGFEVMRSVQADLEGLVQIEKSPSQEGKSITMVVSPSPSTVKGPVKP